MAPTFLHNKTKILFIGIYKNVKAKWVTKLGTTKVPDDIAAVVLKTSEQGVQFNTVPNQNTILHGKRLLLLTQHTMTHITHTYSHTHTLLHSHIYTMKETCNQHDWERKREREREGERQRERERQWEREKKWAKKRGRKWKRERYRKKGREGPSLYNLNSLTYLNYRLNTIKIKIVYFLEKNQTCLN